MSGAIDYLLRVVIPNIKAYDPFYKKLSISCLYDKILHYRFEKMSFFMIVRPFDESSVLIIYCVLLFPILKLMILFTKNYPYPVYMIRFSLYIIDLKRCLFS